MATIPATQSQIGGVVLTGTTATAGPDQIPTGDDVALLVRNDDTVDVTITITVPGATKYGQAQPDVTSAPIPAGGLATIGPFPRDLTGPTDGHVDVTASSTAVTLYAIRT